MEKYHKNEIAPIEKENERDENYKGENESIDSTRTHNNYHIIERDMSYTEYINIRLAQEHKKPRKDAVLMSSFSFGSDGPYFAHLSPEEQRELFTDATNYFVHTYGEENIISAVVHMDETNPHLHLNLIPFMPDKRLCAKELFCPQALRDLQTNLYEWLEPKWHLERGKEGSQAKHLSTAEFKAKKIVEQAKSQAEEITADARAENEDLKEANAIAEEHLNETREKIKEARAEKDQIVAVRDKEADYSQALEDAKNGDVAHGRRGLKEQVVALTVENKRLQEENTRLAKDNADLFQETKQLQGIEARCQTAIKGITMIREREPEAFGRVFFRATSVFQPFVDVFDQPVPLSRSRVDEIKEEIEREKKEEQSKSRPNKNYSSK